ncbi:MAG: serine/threonine protein kinase [Lentisphaerae bacterium]|jgi:eukaryotic-like serine/threonine-protein kinase|nr:serine/threonine protein kinase [Lentisphaerota bacterium]MBT4819041.1 serine/threonine protein kinase [Lentisphaerota bacterium]MBT5612305.1 serine/threonine protein kinase [Lentisphaerota bacterium]MBT7060717.1 serine/threonine protein kinase [Lentisphaerota bacterium]MBT7845284.1 serine/threonine protein kinase [Lentisphaerota bacterium]
MTAKATFGPYVLGEKVGEGGMGAVYQAHRGSDDGQEHYAVKLLSVTNIDSEEDKKRFLQECKALEHVQHPHILELIDYGVEDGVPYLVTEFCTDRNGASLSLGALAERCNGVLEVHTLKVLVPQICWALSYTHQLGMVHRDIKPENVLLQENTYGGLTTKLGDFGLASVTVDSDYIWRPSWEEGEGETTDDDEAEEGGSDEVDGNFSGTYDYMSPEQMDGEPLDARSDVFSFGVMLYRLATGYDRVTFEKPTEINGELPAWIDEMVARAIVPDREERAKSALELLFLLPDDLRPGGIQRSVAY